MEIAELILKYVKALVWPVVTVGLVFGLRDHLRGAISRITRLETPAGAVEFEAAARELREDAEELTGAVPHGEAQGEGSPDAGLNLEESGPQTAGPYEGARFGVFQEAWDAASVSPIGSLITAWLTLESMSSTLLREKDAYPVSRHGDMAMPTEVIKALEGLGLPSTAASVFQELRRLRNKAVHGEEVTAAAARDYVESCRYVARQVYQLGR